jgi:hypothetical protein
LDFGRPQIVFSLAIVSYGMSFGVSYSIVKKNDPLELYVMSVPFMMHTYMHGKRMLNLQMSELFVFTNGSFSIVVIVPSNASSTPPIYYMFFPIQVGISGVFI